MTMWYPALERNEYGEQLDIFPAFVIYHQKYDNYSDLNLKLTNISISTICAL